MRWLAVVILPTCLALPACGGGEPGNGDPDYAGSCPEDVDCSLPGTALVFRVRSSRVDFFNRPWPAETRLTPEGFVDLSDFPNPSQSSIVTNWLDTIQGTTRGFGTNAAAYLVFDGDLDPGSLPGDPAETLEDESRVFLIDVSDGPDRGQRVPLSVRFFPERLQFTPRYTLVVRPEPGFPLQDSSRYALVVTRGVRDARGNPLGASADFERTKYAASPEDEAVRSWWQLMNPVYDDLEDRGLIERRDVAALTVFTTQPILAEMDAVRDFVASRPVPPVSNWSRLGDLSFVYRFEGEFEVAEFQAGDPPEFQGGGGFVFDDQGQPVPQRTPSIPFTLGVPKGAAPAGGWPVVMYAHGTGGTRNGFCDAALDPCELMAQSGIASIGIDQPLHGDRNPGGVDPSLVTFNVTNIEAFRDNFRQGAADLLVLRRVLSELDVPASVSPTGQAIELDESRVGYMGHSQGGLNGPIFLSTATDVLGAVFSAAAGGINIVLLERKDILDIKAALVEVLGLVESEFDLDHPFLNLLQMFAERGDPLNYARRFVVDPPAGSAPKHLFFSEGLLDEMALPVQTENLAAIAGCAPMTPVHQQSTAMQLRGIEPVEPPVSGNVSGPGGEPVTCVLVQYPDDGHFAVFRNADATRHYTGFLDTLMNGVLPSVGP